MVFVVSFDLFYTRITCLVLTFFYIGICLLIGFIGNIYSVFVFFIPG